MPYYFVSMVIMARMVMLVRYEMPSNRFKCREDQETSISDQAPAIKLCTVFTDSRQVGLLEFDAGPPD